MAGKANTIFATECDKYLFCHWVLRAAKKYFEDSEVRRRYEVWEIEQAALEDGVEGIDTSSVGYADSLLPGGEAFGAQSDSGAPYKGSAERIEGAAER